MDEICGKSVENFVSIMSGDLYVAASATGTKYGIKPCKAITLVAMCYERSMARNFDCLLYKNKQIV